MSASVVVNPTTETANPSTVTPTIFFHPNSAPVAGAVERAGGGGGACTAGCIRTVTGDDTPREEGVEDF